MSTFWRIILPLLLLSTAAPAKTLPPIKTVFLILMENTGWSDIVGNTNAPFINQVLLPQASCCQHYYPAPYYGAADLGVMSLPSYIWLEAGTNFDIMDDDTPFVHHQSTSNHFVTLLSNAGITWKAYEEDILGDQVPLQDYLQYVARHDPFVYFDDVTGTNNLSFPYGIAHIRPYAELTGDLTNNTVAQYNFITPNLCDDMHGSGACPSNNISIGDTWLASEIPKIMASKAYANNGAIFIAWDDGGDLGIPIPMIVLSPLAKGGGYSSSVYYTHSSTLRTMQEIFGVTPWLADAANATSLSDLFVTPGFSAITHLPGVGVQLTAVGLNPGGKNIIQASSDFLNWFSICTNWPPTNTFTMLDYSATNFPVRYYRLLTAP